MLYHDGMSLMEALDEYVTGHLEAKKALIVMLNRMKLRSYQKYVKQMDSTMLVEPLKILLIGSSGTGKTHLVTTLEKISQVPLIRIDATDLNPTGAGGGIKSEKLCNMIVDRATEMSKIYPVTYPHIEHAIDQTIVYIDEIDKLGSSFDSSGNWNKHVQSNFLALFDNKAEFEGVSFVFSGAFESITGKKLVKNSMGFNNSVDDPKPILDEEILKAGIIPELLGRINMVVELDVFSMSDIENIIRTRLIPKKQMDMAAYGVFDVEFSEKEIKDIAEKTVKSGQGIRYAKREIEKICLDIEYEASIYLGV